uniref:Uncharacterized protein n=1 Tax=Arundo donax TaxID=35708 RepID=A0A0A9Q7G0_ARUDO
MTTLNNYIPKKTLNNYWKVECAHSRTTSKRERRSCNALIVRCHHWFAFGIFNKFTYVKKK